MTDRIDTVFVYEDSLNAETVNPVFEVLHQHGGRGPDRYNGNYRVSYENGCSGSKKVDLDRVAELLVSFPESYTILSFDEFHLSVIHSNNLTASGNYSGLIFSVEVTPLGSLPPSNESSEVYHRREMFASLLLDLAETTDPALGYGGRVPDAATYVPSEGEIDGTEPSLFEYTLFNETAVEQIGREKLLNAPVWFAKPLKAGSIFVILVEPPAYCSPSTPEGQAIADELGLTLKRVYDLE